MSVIIIVAMTIEESWLNLVLNKKCFRHFGDLSYAIYLNHALIIWLVNDFKEEITRIFHVTNNERNGIILFGSVLIIYSIFTTIIVKKYRYYLKKM